MVGGILKDLGEAIAKKIGRNAQFKSIPSKRVSKILDAGEADGVCYVMQDWIGGDFNWSEPIIRDAGLVVANIDAPVVHSLLDLQNQRIGTILGYVYPELEHAGVTHYERDDAPSMSLNIRKVAEGRMKYALIEALALYYQIRAQPDQRIRTDFVYGTFTASCAFSRQSQVPFAEIDNAIKQLIADGEVDSILQKYK